MAGQRRYYGGGPSEEYAQSIGGPYYNPYSSSPIDIGMTLRQNLAQITAYKQYEKEQEEARKKQDFEDFIKMMQLEKSMAGKPPGIDEQMWGLLGPEEQAGAAREKYGPKKEKPEKPSAFQEKTAFYQAAGYTPEQIAKIELEGRPEKPKEKEAKLPPLEDQKLKIQQFWNRERQKARTQFRQAYATLDLSKKGDRERKEMMDRDLRILMESMDTGEQNELSSLNRAWGKEQPPQEAPQAPLGGEIGQVIGSPGAGQAGQGMPPDYQLVGYDGAGAPIYRGSDGKYYKKQ